MKIKSHNLLLIFSALFFTGSGISYLTGNTSLTGILLIFGFIALALGVRGFEKLKGYSYTLWIFTAVTFSMFYPKYLTSVGDFQFKSLIVPLLQIIMFGMGSQMSFKDFTGVIKMPKGVFVGVVSHYMIMPLVGFGIAKIFSFPPEIAAGIILIGCVPSGLASNVMSFLAKANLALAVTVGAISTLLSPFVTPLLMKWLGGQYIEVNFWSMMLDILNMIILPIVAGFIFNLFAKGKVNLKSKIIQLVSYIVILLLTNLVFMKAKNADFSVFLVHFAKSMGWFFFLPMVGATVLSHFLKGDNKYMEKILSLISMVGIAVIISIITASGRDSLLKVGALLMVTSLLHNLTGYTLGYWLSWLVGMPERDRRTIAFEVGMQNGGLASGLALQMGKVATVGLAPAIFGPLMNVTGSVLANYWRGKPVEEEKIIDEDSGMKVFLEKDNMGTRHDFELAKAYWRDRMVKQKHEPFVLYTFDKEKNAREALLNLPCIHIAKDTGNLICTEVLIFGYWQTPEGSYESVICGYDLSHELWATAKDRFSYHGGSRKNDLEPEPSKILATPVDINNIADVVYVREDRLKDGTIYQIYQAPNAAIAKIFLQQKTVDKALFYIIVETHEGNYGRDIDGIYKEQSK